MRSERPRGHTNQVYEDIRFLRLHFSTASRDEQLIFDSEIPISLLSTASAGMISCHLLRPLYFGKSLFQVFRSYFGLHMRPPTKTGLTFPPALLALRKLSLPMRLLPLVAVFALAGVLSGFAADDEGLVIVDATWKAGSRQSNVTSKVRERIHGNTVEFQASTSILGEPAKGHQKILRVTYRLRGADHSLEVAEGRTLKIPPDTEAPDTRTYTGDQRAQIQRISDATKALNTPSKGVDVVQAVFGANGFWRDITPIVRQSITNDRWEAELHLPFTELGGDPVKGKVKHLVIGYRLDGAPKMGIFDEINGNTIHVVLP
jgi:hypothetical protein